MLRPINAIIRDNVGNIIHRGFVVTGEVAVDNGDGSYDVYIAGEAKAYPKIFTLARNPDLAVEDKVRILYKNGCKELPIILPPVKPTAIPLRYALIIAYPDEIQLFDMDGNLVKQISFMGYSYAGCGITIDSQGNIYIEEDGEVIKKYDSNLNLLATQNIEDANNWISGINMGNDGYLYTFEAIASGYNIKKRSITDLTIVSTIPITANPLADYSGGICLDSNGNFYVIGDNDDICKYSSAGVKLASIDVDNLGNEWAGCAVLGNYVYFVKYIDTIVYLPLDLSTYHEWDLSLSDAEAYAITVADNHLICAGWDAGNDPAVWKYDSNRNLIWKKQLPSSTYGYKAGGYNF